MHKNSEVYINGNLQNKSINKEVIIDDGFIKFEGEHHIVNVPVSYVIVEKIKKDIPFTFIGKNNDVNFCPKK